MTLRAIVGWAVIDNPARARDAGPPHLLRCTCPSATVWKYVTSAKRQLLNSWAAHIFDPPWEALVVFMRVVACVEVLANRYWSIQGTTEDQMSSKKCAYVSAAVQRM